MGTSSLGDHSNSKRNPPIATADEREALFFPPPPPPPRSSDTNPRLSQQLGLSWPPRPPIWLPLNYMQVIYPHSDGHTSVTKALKASLVFIRQPFFIRHSDKDRSSVLLLVRFQMFCYNLVELR